MEVVLAAALLVLLSGLVIGTFYSTLASTRIRENAGRMSSLLRALRAEAAIEGRRYRLGFDPETRQPRVTFEPEPLAEPNTFVPRRSWWSDQAELTGGVRVLACELTGPAAPPAPAAEGAPAALAAITFTPDGGSDSARLVLGTEDEDEPWIAEITLNGADGTIEVRQLDLEEEAVTLE